MGEVGGRDVGQWGEAIRTQTQAFAVGLSTPPALERLLCPSRRTDNNARLAPILTLRSWAPELSNSPAMPRTQVQNSGAYQNNACSVIGLAELESLTPRVALEACLSIIAMQRTSIESTACHSTAVRG